jgi:hexosaminidase
MFNTNLVHLGGDETNDKCWDAKPSIKEYMVANNISNYIEL